MIRTRKALMFARTKLKTRRIRLVLLLVSMSVMFAGLVFIASVTSGITHSVQKFGKAGLGGRFLVQASPIVYQQYGNSELTRQLKPQQEALVKQKTALAKKLGISYDAASDTSLYYTEQRTGPGPNDLEPVLNDSLLSTAALDAQNKAIPGTGFESFSKLAKAAGATNLYRSTQPVGRSIGPGGATTGTVSVLADGKEDYSSQSAKDNQYRTNGVESIQTLGWSQISGGLLRSFLLSGQTADIGADGSIPVVAPYSAVQQILGLADLPDTASSAQKLDRLEQVRHQIAGQKAQLCYRNNASQSLLQKAIQQRAYIADNKNKSDYAAPHVLYSLPTEACGATTIKSDTRTADEKKADAAQQTFDETFAPASAPTQGIIKLRIVGINTDLDTGGGGMMSVSGVLSGILSSSLGYGWFSPSSSFTSGSIAAQAQGGTVTEQPIIRQNYYAEFPSLQAATAFTKQANCTVGLDNTGPYDPDKIVTDCSARHTPFNVVPYGNNAGAVSSFQHSVWKVLKYVILVIVIIAAIIMISVFGKVIADSRRETAVFRSLGATRFDISQIYLTYTLLVSLLVAVLAICVGLAGAAILNARVGPDLSVNAVLAYNAADPRMQFSVIGIDPLYFLAIAGLIVVVGLLSALVPLFTNMRRNPIRDMRDE